MIIQIYRWNNERIFRKFSEGGGGHFSNTTFNSYLLTLWSSCSSTKMRHSEKLVFSDTHPPVLLHTLNALARKQSNEFTLIAKIFFLINWIYKASVWQTLVPFKVCLLFWHLRSFGLVFWYDIRCKVRMTWTVFGQWPLSPQEDIWLFVDPHCYDHFQQRHISLTLSWILTPIFNLPQALSLIIFSRVIYTILA